MIKAKTHPDDRVRGVRDPRKCKVQSGGRLVAVVTLPGVYEEQPMFWTDRPLKFASHIQVYLRRPGAVITDIKWKQLGSKTWWRIPDWPEGNAES